MTDKLVKVQIRQSSKGDCERSTDWQSCQCGGYHGHHSKGVLMHPGDRIETYESQAAALDQLGALEPRPKAPKTKPASEDGA